MAENEDDDEFENTIVDILTAEDTEPEWLVPGLMLQGSMNILAGDAGAGKSYVSYMLGIALAAGEPMFGGLFPAQTPKKVLYFDEENGKQDRDKYLKRCWEGLRWLNGKEPDLALLHENFWPVHFKLGGQDWAERAGEWIDRKRPHCSVFDTATPCFDIENENDNAEASQVCKDVRALMQLTDPVMTSVILKHAKVVTEKGGKLTIRGAKAWKGAADQQMFQVKSAGRPRLDGLSLTRLQPDKGRAYGLSQRLYITPRYTDAHKSGLALLGSYTPDAEHKRLEDMDEPEEGERTRYR